jgi:hypothetical protein
MYSPKTKGVALLAAVLIIARAQASSVCFADYTDQV